MINSFFCRLEHPNKLLHNIFEKLYDDGVISDESFINWEKNNNPKESVRFFISETSGVFYQYILTEVQGVSRKTVVKEICNFFNPQNVSIEPKKKFDIGQKMLILLDKLEF